MGWWAGEEVRRLAAPARGRGASQHRCLSASPPQRVGTQHTRTRPLISWFPASWCLYHFRALIPGLVLHRTWHTGLQGLWLAAALGQTYVKSPESILRELVSRKNRSYLFETQRKEVENTNKN